METNGLINGLVNAQSVSDVNSVLDRTNAVAGDVSEANQQAQTALGRVFFSLIQRMMSDARENSNSGS